MRLFHEFQALFMKLSFLFVIMGAGESVFLLKRTMLADNLIYCGMENEMKRNIKTRTEGNPRSIMRMTSLLLCLCLALLAMASCDSSDNLKVGGDAPSKDGLHFEIDSESASEVSTGNEQEGQDTVGQIPLANAKPLVMYDASAAVEAVMPAMVAVTVQKTVSSGFFTQEVIGYGTGIIVAQDASCLYIVTNQHVVADATSVSLTFVDGKDCIATVKGENALYDLAIITVAVENMDEDTLALVRLMPLGDSGELKVGQGAVAIGNALGYGQSVSVGCISALGRVVENGSSIKVPLIQTDAAINQGNSGGALLNVKGELVGINTLKIAYSESKDAVVEGMGYAIPLSDALPIMNAIIKEVVYEESARGYLGVGCRASVMSDGTRVLRIERVGEGSPAALAGVQAGDILCAVNGKSVGSVEALTDILSHLTGGDKVILNLKRMQGDALFDLTLEATLVTYGSVQGS